MDKVDHVKATLDGVVELFERGDVPAAISKATFPPYDVPAASWSLSNRVLMMLAGTGDARGYRQWQAAGRNVRKGCKSFRILAPRIVKKEKETSSGEKETESRCIGFLAVPVFRVEDTEGQELEYQNIPLPAHPLMDVAAAWGVEVRSVPFGGNAYGWTDGKVIALATPDVLTWLHELMHVADGRAHGPLKGGQQPDQEIVAQLGAATLARLIGLEPEKANEGYSLSYIEGYARGWFPKLEPADAVRKGCHRILGRVCKAIEKILDAANAGVIPGAATVAA